MKHNRIFMSVAMAAIVLVSLCAVSVSTLSVSAAQDSSSTPSLVGAAVGSGAPGVCSQDGTSLDLFIRGADNSLHWKHSDDGVTWPSTDTQIAGPNAAGSAAAAANSSTPGTINVFVRGTDGVLYEMTITNAQNGPAGNPTIPTSWVTLGGKLADNKAPSVCSYGTSTAVFVTGTDYRCYYYATLTANLPPSKWTSLGGILASAPAATATPNGSAIALLVVGTGDSGLWLKQAIGGKWDTSWTSVRGLALQGTSPAAYNWGTGQTAHLGWLVTGRDYNLYNNYVGNSAGYEQIKASLTSSPSVATLTPAMGTNGLAVFARVSSSGTATLSQIDYNYAGSGGWGEWTAIPFA
jgi:hypothetical protein